MDPYEYLLNKLNATIIPTPYSLYKNLEICKKLISNRVSISWTHEHIFKFYKKLDLNYVLRRQNHKELDRFCQQLRQFPDELESKEQVDVLLAVNGLQTSDEKSS